jgi:hypothetical protein
MMSKEVSGKVDSLYHGTASEGQENAREKRRSAWKNILYLQVFSYLVARRR